ncbi:MAG: transglutaminase domain-containing protein [Microbacterium sp.]|nr:transglutaminase domain-containing protein [Microbacterium sp.]
MWLALLATLPPLARVIHTGPWMPGAAVLAAVLLATGFGLRRRRVPAIGVTLAEVVVWALVVTGGFFSGTALWGFLPTGAVVAAVPEVIRTASDEIASGVAPIPATPAMSFVIVASFGLLAIALDHVVLSARMPLLAAIALVLVWLIPSVVVPAPVDIAAFVVLAIAVLALIRAENRTREAPIMATRSGGVAAVAVAIGAVAIVGALVIGPALPHPAVGGAGSGAAARIDPSLDLGSDLRRPGDTPVLTLRSDAPQLPNLRVTTLSIFDGSVWMPDQLRSVALADAPLEPVQVAEGIATTEYRTHVEVTQLSSAYLPIPYPAVAIDGLEGAWRSVPYSRTILSAQNSAQGQNYDVVAEVPRPTLEQIRASQARLAENRVDVYALPEGTPAVIGDLARQVTAGATTDYDRLEALQTWFRGPEFTYSLTAPVTDGFDDTGVAAVAAFLEKKAGYCIHYAGAFALMARELGMPSRIVVGFLPGGYTGDTVDGQRVAAVTTGQLHAWPEVYFDGIGWVPFEPTKSLGIATRYVSAASSTGGTDAEESGPTPTPTSSASAGARPDEARDEATGGTSGQPAAGGDPRPALLIVLGALVVASVPAAAGAARRGFLRRRGGVAAAWVLVQDAAIDLGIAVSAAQSPRAFGVRLVAEGAPEDAVARLVAAVERENYAPRGGGAESAARHGAGGAGGTGSRDGIAQADAIRVGLRARRGPLDRARATLLPRSLVVRPGSAFADRDALV